MNEENEENETQETNVQCPKCKTRMLLITEDEGGLKTLWCPNDGVLLQTCDYIARNVTKVNGEEKIPKQISDKP